MIDTKVMVTLPPNFVAIKFPGYFWDLRRKQLYSIKSGLLKPLKKISHNSAKYIAKKQGWSFHDLPRYSVSVNGQKRLVFTQYLNSLQPVESEIPVV